ncbi:hypothetical protein BC828DRAFT_383166 [Blastocladiella britannica]|nr:hypothetical protein BC828DRAFT_383166 [Blastocladiella britannica]
MEFPIPRSLAIRLTQAEINALVTHTGGQLKLSFRPPPPGASGTHTGPMAILDLGPLPPIPLFSTNHHAKVPVALRRGGGGDHHHPPPQVVAYAPVSCTGTPDVQHHPVSGEAQARYAEYQRETADLAALAADHAPTFQRLHAELLNAAPGSEHEHALLEEIAARVDRSGIQAATARWEQVHESVASL